MTEFAKSHTASRIRAAATRGALSHALIFSGAANRADAAVYASAAFECAAEGDRPCLSCAHCRKVLGGIHPDVIYVRDPEHKELSADVVRAMRTDAFIRPNEGARKVYIFEDCGILNEKDQNILLKTIEEGPPYCAFIFCTENSASLLQTVRSRCVELKLGGGDAGSEGTHEKALELCRLLAEGGTASRTEFFVKLETSKITRDELGAIFEDARLTLSEALLSLYGSAAERTALTDKLAQRLGRAKLMALAELLDEYRIHCTYNVGVGMTTGGFAAECEHIIL
ncbi:MAG: DNA polymerase III subunit delta' [Oscillospiraceae bacterium]|nr:DNA polymerase III subunit delta' [Oscillospiraceae bacterium]